MVYAQQQQLTDQLQQHQRWPIQQLQFYVVVFVRQSQTHTGGAQLAATLVDMRAVHAMRYEPCNTRMFSTAGGCCKCVAFGALGSALYFQAQGDEHSAVRAQWSGWVCCPQVVWVVCSSRQPASQACM